MKYPVSLVSRLLEELRQDKVLARILQEDRTSDSDRWILEGIKPGSFLAKFNPEDLLAALRMGRTDFKTSLLEQLELWVQRDRVWKNFDLYCHKHPFTSCPDCGKEIVQGEDCPSCKTAVGGVSLLIES